MLNEMNWRLTYKQNYQQVEGCKRYKCKVNDFIHKNENVDWALTKPKVSHVFEDFFFT